MPPKISVYVETGNRRVFAGAIEWPGWCRSARDELGSLEALISYARRYKRVLGAKGRELKIPSNVRELRVVERVKGDSTTDFGVPGMAPSHDRKPLSETELERLIGLLQACWKAFDKVALMAGDATLRKGPRGGGRDIPRMQMHVLEGDMSYLNQLGGKHQRTAGDPAVELAQLREVFIETLWGRFDQKIPSVGPRGGARWGPRYAVRRSAWHSLDHAWEMEDRLIL